MFCSWKKNQPLSYACFCIKIADFDIEFICLFAIWGIIQAFCFTEMPRLRSVKYENKEFFWITRGMGWRPLHILACIFKKVFWCYRKHYLIMFCLFTYIPYVIMQYCAIFLVSSGILLPKFLYITFRPLFWQNLL